MQRILILAQAVECDLLKGTLDFLAAVQLNAPAEVVEGMRTIMASAVAAWDELVGEWGIEAEDMARALPRRHRSVETLLASLGGAEDRDLVEVELAGMKEYLAA